MKYLKKVTSFQITKIEKDETGIKLSLNTNELLTSMCLVHPNDSTVIDLESNDRIHFLLQDGSNINDFRVYDFLVNEVLEPNLNDFNSLRQEIVKDNYVKQLVLSYLPKPLRLKQYK